MFHVGDYGGTIVLTFKTDATTVKSLVGASSITCVLRSPAGTNKTLTCSLVTDGTDGKATCTIGSTTFDTSGTWKVQGVAAYASSTFHSDLVDVPVGANL